MQEVWPEGFHYYWSGYCLIRSAAGQQQDSHSCYTAQPFREDLSSQGSLSSAACTAQAGMELRIGRAPLLLQYNHCNGLKFAILAAFFQAAEGSPHGGLSIYMVCPNERVQQTPEFMLCKKEAKSVLAAFGGPSIAGHSSALLSC